MRRMPLILAIILSINASCPSSDKIPANLYYSNRMSSHIDITAFIDAQYPMCTSDFTAPAILTQEYPNFTASNLVLGGDYGLGAIVQIAQNTIKFDVYNFTIGTITNHHQFPIDNLIAFSCKFIVSDLHIHTIANISLDIFGMCINTTHQATYIFKYLNSNGASVRVDCGRVRQKGIFTDYLLSQKRAQSGYTQVWMVECIYLVADGNSWIEIFSSQAPDYYWKIDIAVDQLKNNNITTFQVLGYVYLKGNQYMNGMRVIVQKNYGLIFMTDAQGQKTDRWVPKDEKVLNVKALCDSNVIAVLGQQHIYLLELTVAKSVQNGYVRQVSRVKRQLSKPNVQFLTIGKYIIQKYGGQMVAYFLSQNMMKYFRFNLPKGQEDILIDRQFCHSSSFFIGSKRYILTDPKLLNQDSLKKLILLQFKDCNKTVNLIHINNTAIQQINKDTTYSYTCFDNQIEIEQPIFVGDGVTVRVEWNNVNYPISRYLGYEAKFDGSVLNYVQISNEHIFILTSNGSYFSYILCRPVECTRIHSMQINSSPYLKSQLKIFTRESIGMVNNFANRVIVSAISMGNGYSMSFFNVMGSSVSHMKSQYNSGSGFQWTNVFDMMAYSEQYTMTDMIFYLDKMYFRVLSGYKWIQDSFSHMEIALSQYSSEGYQKFWYDDLQRFYDNVCSVGSNKFIVYRFEGDGSLRMTSAINRNPSFYVLSLTKIFTQFKSSRLTCLESHVGILKDNTFFKVNQQLQISMQIVLQSNTESDLASQHLLVHKINSSIEVHCLESGFKITTLPIPIEQVLLNRYSKFIVLTNKTVLSFGRQKHSINSTVETPSDKINVYATNSNASIYRLKYLTIIDTLKLPTASTISIRSPTFVDNFWNCTISAISAIQDTKTTELSHFNIIDYDQYDFKFEIATKFIEVQGRTVVLGFDIGDGIWIDIVGFDQFLGVAQIDGMRLLGVTNFIGAKFYSIWTSITGLAIFEIQLNFTSKNYTNKTNYCNMSTLANLQDNLYFQHNVYADGQRVFILRYDTVRWDTTYVLDYFWGKQANFRNYLIRNPNRNRKIQIFPYAQPCKVQEIDSSTYNLSERLINYIQISHNGESYLFILLQSHLIVQKYPLSQEYLKYSIPYHYTRVLAKNNNIYLINIKGSHRVYTINWNAYPNQQTLILKQQLVRAGVEQTIDAVYINAMIVTASAHYLYLYHLTDAQLSYAVQELHISKIQSKGNAVISRLSWVSQTEIEAVVAQKMTSTFWANIREGAHVLKVTSDISIGEAKKIRLNNQRYTSEYSVFRSLNEVNMSIRTE